MQTYLTTHVSERQQQRLIPNYVIQAARQEYARRRVSAGAFLYQEWTIIIRNGGVLTGFEGRQNDHRLPEFRIK